MKKRVSLIIAFTFVCAQLSAEITVRTPFSKGMVLQQKQKVTLSGNAEPNEKLTILFRNKVVTVKVGNDGEWKASIETGEAGEGFIIKMTGTISEEYIIEDVLVGEVWLFSGQSNMEMAIKGLNVPGFLIQPVNNITQVIAQANNTRVRGFIPPFRTQAASPANDISGGKWIVANPSSVSNFPSLPYMVSKQLSELLNVPVGFLHCSIGGTSILSWLDQSSLQQNGKTVSYDPTHSKPWTQMSVLYNGLLQPFKEFPIGGFAWYQGESDAWMKNDYKSYLNSFVELCRSHWGAKLPFVIVQLPSYKDERWPFIRQAQWEVATETEHTALVVTMPYGDSADIHPSRKQEVANEMVKAMWNIAYVADGEYPAQFLSSFVAKGNTAELVFNDEIQGEKNRVIFEIAGEDRQFYAGVSVWRNESVTVSADEVKRPLFVRYGWGAYPELILKGNSGRWISPFVVTLE